MKPSESAEMFVEFAAKSGVSILACAPAVGFEQFFSFHAQVSAEGCDDPENDKLLFEWGAFDRGAGKLFELNMTRQFIEHDLDDDDAISQLRLTFKYEHLGELLALAPGNCWSDGRFETPTFQEHVLTSRAFQCVAGLKAMQIELVHGYV